VIAVLQGLMSSEVELVPGGVTGDVTGSELAEVCQQGYLSVMGRNNYTQFQINFRTPRILLKLPDILGTSGIHLKYSDMSSG